MVLIEQQIKSWLVLIFFFTFLPPVANAQDTIGNFSSYGETGADSLLMATFGSDFCRKYMQVDWTESAVDTSFCSIIDGTGFIHCEYRPEFVVYRFIPGPLFALGFIELSKFDSPYYRLVDTGFVSFILSTPPAAFVSDEYITNLAKKELRLGPGRFDVEASFEGEAFRFMWSYRHGKYDWRGMKQYDGRLLIRIHKPDTSRTVSSHSSEISWGKYIVIDALTGEIVDRDKTKMRVVGFP